MILHAVFNFALQQKLDFDTALRGFEERLAQFAAWQKIGVGDDDGVFRLPDTLKVGDFDRFANPQVVAQYQSGGGGTCRGVQSGAMTLVSKAKMPPRARRPE